MITTFQWLRVVAAFKNLEKEMQRVGMLSGQVPQSVAYRMFSRSRIKRWREQGNLNPVKQNNRVYYNVDELTKLSSKYEYTEN